MKTCSKCKINKLKSDFLKHVNTLDGLGSYCRLCRNISSAESKKRNPKNKKEADKKYYLKNSERLIAYSKKYAKEHAQRINELHLSYYHKDKERYKQYAKTYKEKNPLSCKKISVKKSYPKGTPDEVLEVKAFQLLIKDELKKAS